MLGLALTPLWSQRTSQKRLFPGACQAAYFNQVFPIIFCHSDTWVSHSRIRSLSSRNNIKVLGMQEEVSSHSWPPDPPSSCSWLLTVLPQSIPGKPLWPFYDLILQASHPDTWFCLLVQLWLWEFNLWTDSTPTRIPRIGPKIITGLLVQVLTITVTSKLSTYRCHSACIRVSVDRAWRISLKQHCPIEI